MINWKFEHEYDVALLSWSQALGALDRYDDKITVSKNQQHYMEIDETYSELSQKEEDLHDSFNNVRTLFFCLSDGDNTAPAQLM